MISPCPESTWLLPKERLIISENFKSYRQYKRFADRFSFQHGRGEIRQQFADTYGFFVKFFIHRSNDLDITNFTILVYHKLDVYNSLNPFSCSTIRIPDIAPEEIHQRLIAPRKLRLLIDFITTSVVFTRLPQCDNASRKLRLHVSIYDYTFPARIATGIAMDTFLGRQCREARQCKTQKESNLDCLQRVDIEITVYHHCLD